MSLQQRQTLHEFKGPLARVLSQAFRIDPVFAQRAGSSQMLAEMQLILPRHPGGPWYHQRI